MTATLIKFREKLEELQEELEKEIEAHRARFHYTVEAHRVRFEDAMIQHHRNLKMGVREFLATSKVRHAMTVPVIYAVLFPTALLDVFVTIYQHVCFRVYKIPLVRRADYIVVDRHKLAYLNIIEKINCMYCGYANGVFSYAFEIASRTEQFWCPIKHARKIKGLHPRAYEFIEYGDGEDLHKKWSLQREKCRACESCSPSPESTEEKAA